MWNGSSPVQHQIADLYNIFLRIITTSNNEEISTLKWVYFKTLFEDFSLPHSSSCNGGKLILPQRKEDALKQQEAFYVLLPPDPLAIW